MNKIKLKEGLEIDSEHAHISDPVIASMFLGEEVFIDSENIMSAGLSKISEDWMHVYCNRIKGKNENKLFASIKIPLSLIKQALEPEKEKGCFVWERIDSGYLLPDYCIYKKEIQGVIFVKASPLTLNLNIEKLNILWEKVNES
jgi:hypothetical protein